MVELGLEDVFPKGTLHILILFSSSSSSFLITHESVYNYIYIYWNCYSSKGKLHPNGIIFVLNEEQLKISYDIIIPLKTAQRDRNY
jgi:hypothetical protein